MKLILKNNFENLKETYEKENDVITQHNLFNYVVAKEGIDIRGNNSFGDYMNKNNRLRNSTNPNGILSFPAKYYYNEIFFPDDWLTELDDMRHYILNPYIRESLYSVLEYDDIKRKNFLIVSYQVKGNFRFFKQQRVIYMLYHRSKSFPEGAMVCTSKPQEVTIRHNTRRNMIKLEGPNCFSRWVYFDRQ